MDVMNNAEQQTSNGHATIEISATGARCVGRWTLSGITGLRQRLTQIAWPQGSDLAIDGSAIEAIDTTGALLLLRVLSDLERDGRNPRFTGLRDEHQALLDLVHERRVASGEPSAPMAGLNALPALGKSAWTRIAQSIGFLSFVGETFIALVRALVNPRRIRWRALFVNLQSAGVNALPIVALLAFLMGVVIAYQGGIQLKLYGANIFIVELVGLTMLRELAPMVTAIIVAGRTGSAYTAQIGTMKVTQEIDALSTIGIAPLDQLVLPKLFALLIALPLLAVFADIFSLIGGMIIAHFVLGVSFAEFVQRIPVAVSLTSFLIGIGKAPLFAAVIALVGCYQGFRVSGGADSVGRQTTVSVVQSIFLVIVLDALISVLLSWLGL